MLASIDPPMICLPRITLLTHAAAALGYLVLAGWTLADRLAQRLRDEAGDEQGRALDLPAA